MVVVQGSTATLRCTATGEPVPVQRWTRNGTDVSGSRFQTSADGRSLVIGSVQVEDEGAYACHASNSVGTDMAMVTLDVHCKSQLCAAVTIDCLDL